MEIQLAAALKEKEKMVGIGVASTRRVFFFNENFWGISVMNNIRAFLIGLIVGGFLIYVIDGISNFHGYVKCYRNQDGGDITWTSDPAGYEAQCAAVSP